MDPAGIIIYIISENIWIQLQYYIRTFNKGLQIANKILGSSKMCTEVPNLSLSHTFSQCLTNKQTYTYTQTSPLLPTLNIHIFYKTECIDEFHTPHSWQKHF